MSIHPQLQWGHRFISVETDFVPVMGNRGDHASMGPPIYIGGNAGMDRGVRGAGSASMVPPIYIGGNFLSLLWPWMPPHGASMGPPIYIGGNLNYLISYLIS